MSEQNKAPSSKSLSEAEHVVKEWQEEEGTGDEALVSRFAVLLDKAFEEGWEACLLNQRLSEIMLRRPKE